MKKDLMQILPSILDEILDKSARITVGKILKRIDICDSTANLKANVRELIYEDYRNIKAFVELHAKSLSSMEDTVIEFKS